MSKMLKALNKVREERGQVLAQRNTDQLGADAQTSFVHGSTVKQQSRLTMIIVGLLAVFGLISVSINMRTLAELRKSGAVSADLVKILTTQEQKINQLEKIMHVVKDGSQKQSQDLGAQLKGMGETLRKTERDIEEMAMDSNVLSVSFNDLNQTNQRLTDKYISLAEEVENLRKEVKAFKKLEIVVQ